MLLSGEFEDEFAACYQEVGKDGEAVVVRWLVCSERIVRRGVIRSYLCWIWLHDSVDLQQSVRGFQALSFVGFGVVEIDGCPHFIARKALFQ